MRIRIGVVAGLAVLGLGAEAFGAADLSPGVQAALGGQPAGATLLVWVFFANKGSAAAEKAALRPQLVSERSLRRRAKVLPPSRLVDATDLPLQESDVALVVPHVLRVRQRSKWFNGVSVEATAAQIRALAALPRVRSIELVARYRRTADEPIAPAESGSRRREPGLDATPLDYGPSLTQVQIMNVPALHDLGFTGQNVLIGHFDNGYRLLSHEVFATTQIVAGRDFVDHDADPAPPPDAPLNFGAHGIATLSVLGGFHSGELVGVAFGAQFVLARTENDASETPVEEDNWIAAIEWADSLGIDVASTSLGYLGYDAPFTGYTWENMNGNTARITRAADLAVGRGIVVVNSAGNEGFNADHNTLLAPADGDSVVAVGAVTGLGARSSFSSVGPTTDVPARIKPDIAAMGSAVHVARTTSTTSYGSSSGTSFSCPLAAGVAALLLSARPSATPMQIRDALRTTASQAMAPDNLLGWGIIDALAALHALDATDVTAGGGFTPVFRLEPNFPNPFNPSTTIAYRLDEDAFVTLRIYDMRGRLVRTLVRGAETAARHQVRWNGLDDAGRHTPSGVYVCDLNAAAGSGAAARLRRAERKIMLVE